MSRPETSETHRAEPPSRARSYSGLGKDFFRRLRQNIVWHDCFGKAAELAFFFQLAFFPLLIFLLSVIGFVPGARQTILFWLGRLMPAEATSLLEKWVSNFLGRQSGGILSFSLLFSVWSASNGVRTLIQALNRAYEVTEGRPFWHSQLLAIGLLMTIAVLGVGGIALITFGDTLIAWISSLAGRAGIDSGTGTLWRIFNDSIGLLMLFSGLAVIYHFGPNVQQDWRSIIPGTVFAVTAIITASFLFSAYLRYVPTYDAVYGSLGAVVLLMLWLYLVGLMLYLGGEINSEVRKLLGKPARQKR
jgi:membrane protein